MASPQETSTLESARAHARSQAGAATAGVTVPVTAAVDLPPGVEAGQLLWDEVIPVGGYASLVLPRGSMVRLQDTAGDACLQLVAYVVGRPWERLNVADTVKVQWQAYLGQGAVLLSDMGRSLLTIVEDSAERHDCLCGGSNRNANAARYGDGSVSGSAPNARDLLVLAAAKHGLGRGDVPTPVNLFKSVRVADDGALTLDGSPQPGGAVVLRADLDVLLLLANTPHPLDDRPDYTGSPVRGTSWRVPPPGLDDPLRTSTPERERAFQNNDELVRSWT